jgi:hypothetical protein
LEPKDSQAELAPCMVMKFHTRGQRSAKDFIPREAAKLFQWHFRHWKKLKISG